jgi:hypothetical protein
MRKIPAFKGQLSFYLRLFFLHLSAPIFVITLLSLFIATDLAAHSPDNTQPKTFKGRVIAPAMWGWLARTAGS